jgi:uncharacterized circularly permuted ATP-grasp superfamily protein
MKFTAYETDNFYDEMFVSDSTPRPGARLLKERSVLTDDFARQAAAESLLLQNGITFNVYNDNAATEKIFPFDVIPRIVEAAEWDWIEKGLKQRVYALNLFVDDIYHEQKIVKDNVVPEYLIQSARSFRKECVGLNPPQKVWCHITGTDLVRDRDGQMYVLEDNLRCPSGVSYVLENRRIMKRTFPQVFEASRVRPVDEYPSRLLSTLQSLFPGAMDSPKVAVLTPGIYNSAYYEHSFLAQQMGVELVEGRDLVALNNRIMMRTTKGFEPVDVLYRIDDDFSTRVFRSDSLLSVAGLMDIIGARGAGEHAGDHVPTIIDLRLCAKSSNTNSAKDRDPNVPTLSAPIPGTARGRSPGH